MRDEKKEKIRKKSRHLLLRLYKYLSQNAFSVIITVALLFTIGVKFYHAVRVDMLNQYFFWIVFDVLFLLGVETLFFIILYRFPTKAVYRTLTIFAALICTYAVLNAGWIIRTGTQILPHVLLPLFRDPLNALQIIGGNLIKMPLASVVLLVPSALALMFLFSVLAKPRIPRVNVKRVSVKIMIFCIFILMTALSFVAIRKETPNFIISEGLEFNAHLKGMFQIFSLGSDETDILNDKNFERVIPFRDEVNLTSAGNPQHNKPNIVIVILEGVQFQKTSLAENIYSTTPFLSQLSKEAVNFTEMRSALTHTTKAVFSILTGRYPSASQDLAETVPVDRPYAGLAAILGDNLNYKTAFFQSAKGNFESRPSMVHNLGFDKFWSRENLKDPNLFVGYLGSDEFAMIDPALDWINEDNRPYLLTMLCSVTHDPYEVPEWYSDIEGKPIFQYLKTIRYTDEFIETLYRKLQKQGQMENTIFCVVGDHGEAFGEHGLHGHERIAFDEVLKVPWVIKIPGNDPQNISKPVSSIDVTPTILAQLGLKIDDSGFLGKDVLNSNIPERKVYFSGWLMQSPFGYVKGDKKFVYNPTNEAAWLYDLEKDPDEVKRTEIKKPDDQKLVKKIITWRRNTIMKIRQKEEGRIILYDKWLVKWSDRLAWARFEDKEKK